MVIFRLVVFPEEDDGMSLIDRFLDRYFNDQGATARDEGSSVTSTSRDDNIFLHGIGLFGGVSSFLLF